MTQTWLEPVAIGDTHPGDGMQHDGFVDISIGVALSSQAVSILNKLLPAKRSSVDSVVCINQTAGSSILKVIAKPKPNGNKRTERELHKMAEGAMSTIQAWASKLGHGDISMCMGHAVTEEQIKACMADHSAPTGDING